MTPEELATRIKAVTVPLQTTLQNLTQVALWRKAEAAIALKLLQNFHTQLDELTQQAKPHQINIKH